MLGSPGWAQDAFQDLGTLGGSSYAQAVSADGAVVVGWSKLESGSARAFRWADGKMTDLGTLGGSYSAAYAVSADGAVVVGESNHESGFTLAFRWADGEMTDLGTLGGRNSAAFAVSADGTVVVGHSEFERGNSDYRAFRWADGNWRNLQTLGGTNSTATAVSADGAVVVGWSQTANSGTRAFRWTLADGKMASLGTLGGTWSRARGVSADGAVVVGESQTANSGTRAFRWTLADDEMTSLGTLGGTWSIANAVSADGAVVVGQSYIVNNSGIHAFRWTDGSGMKSVADWVVEQGDTVPLDYVLTKASGVSADGKVIVGDGKFEGKDTVWLVRETTPTTQTGFLPDTAAFNRSIIQTGSAAVSSALEATGLVLNGAHHRTLLDIGVQTTPTGWFGWSTADGAKNDYIDATTTLAEIGVGRDIGNYRVGIAMGATKTRQNLDLGGNATFDGNYILAEVDHAFELAGGSAIHASLLGYYAAFDSRLNRAYASGAGTDISSGSPDLSTAALRARVDWINATMIGSVSMSPYAALTLTKTRVDAYTETGGAFPVRYDAATATTRDLRIGSAFTLKPSDLLNLRIGIEGVHQFENGLGAVNGGVIDLYAFNLAGEKRKSTWARTTIDVDYALSSTSMVTGGLSLATQGSQPTIGATLGLQASF
nr:autotransporter domain-containing protein [Pontibaca salina]